MGIAIALVYIPLLLIFAVANLMLGLFVLRKAAAKNGILLHYKISFYLAGVVAAILLTTGTVWWFLIDAKDWDSVIGPLAIFLLGPLCIGLLFIILFVRSNTAPVFNYLTAGVFHSMMIVPIAGLFTIVYYDDIIYKPSFDQLCTTASVNILENIAPASSVAFVPENFHTSNKHGADVNQRSARALLLVPNTSLSFIEAQVHEWDGSDKYERIVKEYNIASPTEVNYKVISDRVNISRPTADYIVTPSAIPIAEGLSKRMHGNRIEVRRVLDQKLIAYTQYYWDNTSWWECPQGISRPDFIRSFIAEALNVPVR